MGVLKMVQKRGGFESNLYDRLICQYGEPRRMELVMFVFYFCLFVFLFEGDCGSFRTCVLREDVRSGRRGNNDKWSGDMEFVKRGESIAFFCLISALLRCRIDGDDLVYKSSRRPPAPKIKTSQRI